MPLNSLLYKYPLWLWVSTLWSPVGNFPTFIPENTQLNSKHSPVFPLSVFSPSLSLLLRVLTVGSAAVMAASQKRISSRKLGRFMREQRGRLYIIRRCIVMLLCSRDWWTPETECSVFARVCGSLPLPCFCLSGQRYFFRKKSNCK